MHKKLLDTILGRGLLYAALLIFVSSMGRGENAKPDDILGTWSSETLKVEMIRAGKEYQAKLIWGSKVVEADGVTFKIDAKNPDASLRSRSLRGIAIIQGLVWNQGGWTGGSIYDGSSGKSYQCKAEIKDGKLLLRAFAGMPMMGRTLTFTRVVEAERRP
jgi:uncharacterized protein (DUF2147 family)